jgi:GAF domain-containing protein
MFPISSLEMDEVLAEIATAAILMNAPLVTFWTVDDAAEFMSARAYSDRQIGARAPAPRRRIGEGAVGWVAQYRQLLHIPDIYADSRISGLEWAASRGFNSFLGVPVMLDE